ncbi:MAG: hypothetical protein JW895_05555 [Thermoleophilaceae bacterium]|nr:hypothetical protein [Thermoleophilaceae bacterium]
MLLLAVAGSLAVPSIASAASATLSSPPDGATYYAGSSFPWRVEIPHSASFDRGGCEMGTKVGGIQRRTLPSGGFASEGGTLAGTFTNTAVLDPGDYQFRAWLDCGGPEYIYSAVRTIHVREGNAPPGGTPDPSELEAVCKRLRDSIADYARLIQRENDVVPALEYIERFTQRTGWAVSGVGLAAPPPLKAGFKVVASLYDSEYKLAKYIQFRHEQDHKSHVIQLGGFNRSYSETCDGVKATALASFAAWPASMPLTQVGAAKAGGRGALLRQLRQAAANERATFKTLEAALRKGDAAAVRKQAAKAVKLIGVHRGLVKALVRDPAARDVRLSARHLKKPRRQDKFVRGLIGKPAAKVLVNQTTARAESRLIKLLRQEPLLP